MQRGDSDDDDDDDDGKGHDRARDNVVPQQKALGKKSTELTKKKQHKVPEDIEFI